MIKNLLKNTLECAQIVSNKDKVGEGPRSVLLSIIYRSVNLLLNYEIKRLQISNRQFRVIVST